MKEIKWATPENPRGLWANCVICGKDIKKLRTRKNVCSEACRLTKQHNIDNKSYAKKMAEDPDFARKQSAKQYARIKADPEKMEAKRIAQNERMQMPNYKESARKSHKKYRSNPANMVHIAKKMREYRDQNPEIIAEIEAKRVQKRLGERERLRIEQPELLAELQRKERDADRQRKAQKRLADLQRDLRNMDDAK